MVDMTPEEEAAQLAQWAAATPAPAVRRITILAMRNRFTKAEKVRIDLAAIDNPAAAMEVREQSAALRVALADLNAASYVDLDRPDTQADIQMIEAAGLIAEGRADEIIHAEIQETERYNG